MAKKEHICPKCGKCLSTAYSLRRHIARKTPCTPIVTKGDLPEDLKDVPLSDNRKCQFCGKVFSHPYIKNRHMRENCRVAPNGKDEEGNRQSLCAYVIKKAEKYDEMKEEADELKRLLQTSQPPPTVVTNNNIIITNNIVINNNIICFHMFGREDVAHITKTVVKNLLNECTNPHDVEQSAKYIIFEMLKLIYSPNEKPENWTSFSLEGKKQEALILSPNGWDLEHKVKMYTSMVDRALDELFILQPHEDAGKYTSVLKVLSNYEKSNVKDIQSVVDTVLERNRELLLSRRGILPVVGDKEKIAELTHHTHLPPQKSKEDTL